MPSSDEGSNNPWSSKHLRECYQQGARTIRLEQTQSQSRLHAQWRHRFWAGAWARARGREVAAAPRFVCDCWSMARRASPARCQDIGTGTYTIFAQVVADKTGLPVDKIHVVLGDSDLPPGPTSGGSAATATVLPAIVKATQIRPYKRYSWWPTKTDKSPFQNADPKTLKLTAGRIHAQDKSPTAVLPSRTSWPCADFRLSMARREPTGRTGSQEIFHSLLRRAFL